MIENKVPVSTFFAISLIIVFLLYFSTLIKTIPCGTNIMTTFYRNFIHIDIYHLLSNLFALYALSRIEVKIGLKRFLLLISFLLVFNTVVETIFYKINPSYKCSIGFSGILFGVLTWELCMTRQLNIYLIISIIILVCTPSLKSENISLIGHAIGAFSGVVGGIIWRRFGGNKDMFKNNIVNK